MKKISLLAVVLINCLFLWSCSVTRETDTIRVSARLVRVVSGQTIEVIISERDNQPQRVRIIGIDAPKLEDRSWSERILARLQELLKGDRASAALRDRLTLEIENDEPDRYNRIFAHVWQDDILISEQLAKEGYVLANTQYPHRYSDRIFHAQEYARILGYGIWNSEVRGQRSEFRSQKYSSHNSQKPINN